MDSTFATLQLLGRDLKNSLDVSSSAEIDRQLKELAHAIEAVRETLERARKSQEVKSFIFPTEPHNEFLSRKTNSFVNVSNEH